MPGDVILLREAKQLNKDGMIFYVWIRYGEVMMRETKYTPAKKIHKINELVDISKAVLPNVRLKPDSYGFRSMKMAYGRNLDLTPKSYGFLVINVNCFILINERKI